MVGEKWLHANQVSHREKHREKLATQNHLIRTGTVGIVWLLLLIVRVDDRTYGTRTRLAERCDIVLNRCRCAGEIYMKEEAQPNWMLEGPSYDFAMWGSAWTPFRTLSLFLHHPRKNHH